MRRDAVSLHPSVMYADATTVREAREHRVPRETRPVRDRENRVMRENRDDRGGWHGEVGQANDGHGRRRVGFATRGRQVNLDVHEVCPRVGVHSGFVITNSDELLGRNVVLTSRIAAHAEPGEILVSSSLKQYTENDPGFHFEPRGEHHFKGLLGEHVIYSVPWR